ncbi:MAG: hypothetical protein DWP95_04540 [Proteobacteria bacterium]|nr:MAG: hypothetical protein DWP95_04540 [Pseudomonadota bacterium]
MLNRWILTALLSSSMLQTDVNLNHKTRIIVGSGLGCHYPPDRLNQAIKEHNTIYLTTESVYPPIHINNPEVTIIGGLSNCRDHHHPNSQKSLISGFHQQTAITITGEKNMTEVNPGIHLKKLRIINGFADYGGGFNITGPTKVQIEDSVIEHNFATHQGGGISLSGQSIKLKLNNSRIQFNQAGQLGGAISCHGNHKINANHEQQIKQNTARMANNLLLDLACFIKFNPLQ